jgi:lipoate-protein ligase A
MGRSDHPAVALSPSAALRAGSARVRSSSRAPVPSVATLPQGDNHEWFLWVDGPRPGWANMAIDQTLLDRAELLGESWLRLYSWEPHCLSFGRHEPAARRYDAERIAARRIDTVRRPTGGRAVWHGPELTYAVAAPGPRFGSLQEAYLEIHDMIGQALGELGIEAVLASSRRSEPLDAGACFSQPAGGEVLVGGRKVVGSAQLRRGGALLQHGSILLADRQGIVRELMQGPAGQGSLSGQRDTALPLLGGSLTVAELAEVIAETAAARWPGDWNRMTAAGEVIEAASRHYPQFRSPAWTWAR